MGCDRQLMAPKTTFMVTIGLALTYFVIEISAGFYTRSMTLIADSFHMFTDVFALIIGFMSYKLSQERNDIPIEGYTFGMARAEVVGALVNAVFLLALCCSILVGSIQRFVAPVTLHRPLVIIIVGVAGFVVNFLGIVLFHGHIGGQHNHTHGSKPNQSLDNSSSEEEINGSIKDDAYYEIIYDEFHPKTLENTYLLAEGDTELEQREEVHTDQLNMKSVYMHILGDLLGSLVVIVGALFVFFIEESWVVYVDPILSIVMVIIIFRSTLPILRESVEILLQHVPTHIQLKQLEKRLLKHFPEIIAIHEFHVWQLAGNKIIASVHVKFSPNADYKQLSPYLKAFFHREGIHSTTFQPEYEEGEGEQPEECMLSCDDESCAEKSCCTPKKSVS